MKSFKNYLTEISQRDIDRNQTKNAENTIKQEEAIGNHETRMLKSAKAALVNAFDSEDIPTIQNIVGKDVDGKDVDLEKIKGMKEKLQSYGYDSIRNHMGNLMQIAARNAVNDNPDVFDPKQLSMLAHQHMMATNPHYKSGAEAVESDHAPLIASHYFDGAIKHALQSREQNQQSRQQSQQVRSALSRFSPTELDIDRIPY